MMCELCLFSLAMAEDNAELLCVKTEDQNDQNTLCMICHGVMDQPFMTTCCGKSFCEACIKRLNTCPNCNASNPSIYLNRALRDIIDAQQVYCVHKSDGCEWVGERGKHGEHLQSCDLDLVDCKFGCGHRCLSRDMEKHLEENVNIHQQLHIKSLNADVQSQRDTIETQTEQIEILEGRLRGAAVDVQLRILHIATLKASVQRQTANFEKLNRNKTRLIYALVVLCPVLLGCMYIQLSPHPARQADVVISAGISEVVVLAGENPSWKINIPNYWFFNMLSASVKVVSQTIEIAYSAKIPVTVNAFAASIIVQVLSPRKNDHHVSRIDVRFEATDKKNWYATKSTQLIDLGDSNKKFYENDLKLRIVNVEVDLNSVLPVHFSMCHFQHFKENDSLLWNTFPFYIKDYKFMIYVYANVDTRDGKALTMKLYRMRGEKDEMLPDTLTVTSIPIKLMKTAGGHTFKSFEITGKAVDIVKKGTKVDFQPNDRFSQYSTRSNYGATFTIPHAELDQYIDHDCFIFYVLYYT